MRHGRRVTAQRPPPQLISTVTCNHRPISHVGLTPAVEYKAGEAGGTSMWAKALNCCL
jgi:hypothetical protein